MNSVKVIIPRNAVVAVDEDNNVLCGEAIAEGEKLVEVGRYNDFVKPKYDERTGDFIESATPEDIAIARPTPSPKQITEEEKAADLLKVIALNVMDSNELLKTFGIEPRPTDPA